ncbi:putative GRIP and coiled-coil domain-containing protein [Quillaja saponaria]|uniref:GRIP and coiled-coil domain-containing protein n=1 Tax=Quillaja saponaria TaxID=32244 RepID=A0AAD7QAM2_QUISA|nr:putative GRIP and coiled-coil domain-containing protein [Quillaja saponaria]
MASQTVASDHISNTDEKVEKQVDEVVKAIEKESVSLYKENEEKDDKATEEPSQANPSSKSEEDERDKKVEPVVDEKTINASAKENEKAVEAPILATHLTKSEEEGEDKKAEPAAVEVEKTDYALAEGDDSAAEALSPATLLSKSGEDKQDEPAAVEVEKTDDALPKGDDKAVEGPSPATLLTKLGEGEGEDKKVELAAVEIEKTDNDAAPVLPIQVENEKVDNDSAPVLLVPVVDKLEEEKDPIPDSQETPLTKLEGEGEGEDKKVEPVLVENEKGDNDAAPVLPVPVVDKLEEEKEPIPDSQATPLTKLEGKGEGENKQVEPALVEIEKVDNEKEPTPDSQATLLTKLEGEDKKAEPAVVEIGRSDNDAAPLLPVHVIDKLEEEKEPISDSQTTTVIEPVIDVTKSDPEELLATESNAKETSKEPEKEEKNQQNIVDVPESSPETIEKPSDAVEINIPTESDAKVVKETETSEAGPTEVEKAEPLITEAKKIPGEPKKEPIEKGEEEQPKDISEKPSDGAVEVIPHKELDAEIVKEIGNSKLESVVTDVEEKVGEQLEVTEQIEEKSKDVENKEIPVSETVEVEGSFPETLDDTKLLKEEQTFKEEGTSEIKNSEEISIKEAQPALKDEVESSPGVTLKVGSEDNYKDSSQADVVEELSKEVETKPEQVSVKEETQTVPNEDEKNSSLLNLGQKVDTTKGDKIEPGKPDPVEGNEANTENTEENIKDERSITDSNKVLDEVTTAVNESVKEEHPDSKLELKGEETQKTDVADLEKESVEDIAKKDAQNPEQPTKDSDNTKPAEELPKEVAVKPTQKQSNTILSKVKQSLVKAKKAITGKSPTSKTISTDTKDDIKVK